MKTKLRPGWVLTLLCTVLFFYGFYLCLLYTSDAADE